MRIVVTTLLLAAASPAWAVGVGSSVGAQFGNTGGFLPSLDLHFDPFVLQIHVLEFVNELTEEDVRLGANFYGTAHATAFEGPWQGVVQPGVGLDIYADPFRLDLTGEVRLGAQTANERGGFGIYVVPALGLRIDDNDDPLLAGGAVQISAWFGS